MSSVQNPELEELIAENPSFVDGEVLETSGNEKVSTETKQKKDEQISTARHEKQISKSGNQKSFLQYIFLPFIFLTAALLGGLRINAADAAILFLKPPLVCLIFASVLLVLFLRAYLIRLSGWFSESFSTVKNIANAAVLLTFFFASTQIFNSLLPEKGLPFWIVAFCFFWTLWNNLFAEFNAKRLVQSLGGMFGLAFVVKYLILANLTAPDNKSWIQGILENPTQEAFTWLLDLPRFSAATGYIQFFAVVFYLIGLFLLKPTSNQSEKV